MSTIDRGFQLLAVAACSLLIGLIAIGATESSSDSFLAASRSSQDYFTQTNIGQDSVSEFFSLQGSSVCKIFGEFGTGSVDVETEIAGTDASTDPGDCVLDGTSIVCQGDIGQRGITASTEFVPVDMGFGSYRIRVTGGDGTTDLTYHCRVVDG